MNTTDLATIATEIGGIAKTLSILSAALDPNSEFDAAPKPEAYSTSLYTIALHLERIENELDDAHMRLEVKPSN